MFLLLILLIQSRQQQNVIKSEKWIAIQSNVNTVIETFEGTVLQERIEFENDFRFPNPCKLIQHPFQLTFLSESQFNTKSFINGTLDQQILQQITIAQVGLGVMVLKNAGHLFFYNICENLILRSNHEYPELSNVSSAVIELINEKLIILTDQKSWILSPNFSDEDIFDQKYLEEIEISQVNKQIIRSHQVDDYLYILYEEVGLRVFKFYDNKLNQILQLNQSIFDFSVIKTEGNHYVLYLEKKSGLQFSQLNLKTNVFEQISDINLLYNVIQGNGLNIYKNQLLIFNNSSTESSCLSLYLFDIEQSTLNKIGTQHFKDQILSIQASEDLILVFGSNVHFTLSWSVFYNPKQSNTTYIQQFILPGLKQQIFKINEKRKQMVVGITNNTLTVIEIELQKAVLECLVTSRYPSSFSFNYYVKTMNCQQEQIKNSRICQVNNTYILNVISSQKESKILLYLIIGLILNLIIILIITLQYYQYKKIKFVRNGFDEFEFDSQKSSTARQKKSQNPDFEKLRDLHAPKASRTPDAISPIIIFSDHSSN